VRATLLAHSTGQRVVHGLRTSMFDHLQRMPLTFFTQSRTTELQTHLVTDVDGLVLVLTGTTSVRTYMLHDSTTATPRDLMVADCSQKPPKLQAFQTSESH